jgi:hypothetical protein
MAGAVFNTVINMLGLYGKNAGERVVLLLINVIVVQDLLMVISFISVQQY